MFLEYMIIILKELKKIILNRFKIDNIENVTKIIIIYVLSNMLNLFCIANFIR